MVTIYHIAEKAGVSGSTVSRALNGSRLVSDEVRERIRLIADELGFEKRNVRRHRERTILNIRLVLPDHESPERTLFFDYTQLVDGLNQGFAPTSINVLSDLGGPGFIPFRHKKGGDSDAFVFAFNFPSPSVLETLEERQIPFVILNRSTPGFPCIAMDHARGMRDLVEHVTASGARSIKPALVGLNESREVFLERGEALTKHLRQKKIPFSLESDVLSFNRLADIDTGGLRNAVGEYNVLFCINDLVGSIVLSTLARLGVSVPDECQVTGFDDSPARRLTRPLLTTVSMPVFDLAKRAAQRLSSEVIDGLPASPVERFRGTLLVGGSTLPPAS